MDKELYIDGELVDLGEDTVIALTKQISDIADITSKLGDFTNEFELPFTQRNQLILGLANQVQSGGTIPYRKVSAKLIDKGVETIPNGYAVVRVAQDSYKLTIYQNNSDIFNKIKGRLISDIDFSDLTHRWDIQTVSASKLNEEGYIYPIINYGENGMFQTNLELEGFYPAIFAHTIVHRIFTENDWSLDLGAFAADVRYLNLILPWANDEWVTRKQDYFIFNKLNNSQTSDIEVSITYDYESFTINGAINITFQFVDENDDFDFDPALSSMFTDLEEVYIFNNQKGTVTVTGSYTGVAFDFGDFRRLSAVITGSGGGGAININVKNIEINIASTDDVTAEVNEDTLEHHDTAQLIEFIGGNVENKYRLEIFTTENAYNAGYFDEIFPLLQGGRVVIEDHLPELSQEEFLKTVMYIFGIIPNGVGYNQTMQFKSYNEILDNINDSVDMSDKYVESNFNPIEHDAEIYAQTNRFTWINDDHVGRNDFNGSFTIPNEILEPQIDFINLGFSSSIATSVIGGVESGHTAPLLDKFSDPDEVKSITPRLLILNKQDIGTPIDYFQVSVLDSFFDESSAQFSDIPFSYFSLAGEDNNLDWETLLEEYYPVIIEILQQYKKIIRNFTLKAPDVQNFNHFIPWYINKYSAKFIPAKIDNYKSINVTSVHLIKV